jgi:metallophosphoesterase superfamily enzyme
LLAVADLHLGYAWAHRHAGQLMPITARDTTPDRLRALVDDYKPERLVLLGDIVHRAVPVAPVREALLAVLDCLPPQLAVTAVAGNHDRDIENLLRATTASSRNSLLRERLRFRARRHGLSSPRPRATSKQQKQNEAGS